jgi:hypothetical protein
LDLNQESKKLGGDLSFEQILKIHGIWLILCNTMKGNFHGRRQRSHYYWCFG